MAQQLTVAKILLIEDDEPQRDILVSELEEFGHRVVCAKDGEEGLAALLDYEPDLIICDRVMPNMSGYEVLELLREAYPEYNTLPFIFLTGLADSRDRMAVAHLAPEEYLMKPIDFDVLHNTINRVLKKKASVA